MRRRQGPHGVGLQPRARHVTLFSFCSSGVRPAVLQAGLTVREFGHYISVWVAKGAQQLEIAGRLRSVQYSSVCRC